MRRKWPILIHNLRASRFVRFLLAGGLNTLATYLLYLACLSIFSYRISYAIAYCAGLLIAYFSSRYVVFNSHRGVRSILLFPLIYIFQFGLGLAILHAWVEWLGLSAKFGPLAVVVLTIPVTYLLSKSVFAPRAA